MPPQTALVDPRSLQHPEPSPGGRDRRIDAMVDLLAMANPPTIAAALKMLRLAYPDSPLALRLAALGAALHGFDPNGIRLRE